MTLDTFKEPDPWSRKNKTVALKPCHDRLCWLSPPLTEYRLARQGMGREPGKMSGLSPAFPQGLTSEPGDHPGRGVSDLLIGHSLFEEACYSIYVEGP